MASRSSTASPAPGIARRNTARSRASSITTDRITRISEEQDLSPLDPPPALRGGGSGSFRSISAQNSPRRELPGFDFPVQGSGVSRPTISRTTSNITNGTTSYREQSPAPAPPVMPRLSRVPTEPTQLLARNSLRVAKRESMHDPVFGDDNQSDVGSDFSSRNGSATWSVADTVAVNGGGGIASKRPPPPPPPSRSTKPPPPLPLKRSALSSGEVPGYR